MNNNNLSEPEKRGDFTVYNVTPVPGGDSYLFVAEDTCFVYDTGFGFSAGHLYKNIKEILKDRTLDYILLTHSHYDHAFGSAYLSEMYPSCKIIAHPYAAYVFGREGARKTMVRLDNIAASSHGYEPDASYVSRLHVDILADDNTEILLGSHKMRVVALPGHTKDSIGFYFPECGLFLGSESTGVIVNSHKVMPAFLISYDACISSINTLSHISPRYYFVPHQGIISGDSLSAYINNSLRCHAEVKELITQGIRNDLNASQIFEVFKENYYLDRVKDVYPLSAFEENAGIMIRLLTSTTNQL